MDTKKLCECGCEQPTKISKYTDFRWGTVKGQPVRFIHNHNHRGKQVSVLTRKRLRASRLGRAMKETDNYRTLHARLNRWYPKIGVCEKCGNQSKTEYAKIKEHKYTDKREDYYELCILCHKKYDRKGIKLSEETRKRMSEARIRYEVAKRASK